WAILDHPDVLLFDDSSLRFASASLGALRNGSSLRHEGSREMNGSVEGSSRGASRQPSQPRWGRFPATLSFFSTGGTAGEIRRSERPSPCALPPGEARRRRPRER